MAAGAAAAYIKALRTNANPRTVTYGGSADAQEGMLDQFGHGVTQGNADYSSGINGLDSSGSAAGSLAQQGRVIASSAGTAPSTYMQSAGTGLLANYQPGQVAATQQQQALDQGAMENLGAARSGGALGLRNGLVANAGANIQAAGQAAAQRAQEQQQYLGAQVGQANQDQAAQMQASQFGQQQMLQGQQIGLGAQAQGIGLQSQAANQTAALGLNNQGQYLGQQQNVYNTQNQNNENYEAQRQANAQQKRSMIAGIGTGLMSGATQMFSKM